MRKKLRSALALLAAGTLIGLFPRLLSAGAPALPSGRQTVRVWAAEENAALLRWLRKAAAAYEKQTGRRVYLRSAAPGEAEDAGAVPPDVLIARGDGEAAALAGYALFTRDAQALLLTPAPTGFLFARPAPSPGPSPSPAPTPDPAALGRISAPAALAGQVERAAASAHPLRDLLDGKADTALLTAGEAAALGGGFRAWALPGRKGFLPYCADARTPLGADFAAYLLSEPIQRGLAAVGLYSPLYRLYGADSDPLRALVESAWFAE